MDTTTPPQPEEPRRLLRSTGDRVISGVCGGVARYFGVDPTVIRIAAVALALFGGAGVLLYLGALLLMPSDDPAAQASDRGRALTAIGLGLLLVVGWPVVLGGSLAAIGLLVPVAFLAPVGLVVWWLVSGDGPNGEPRDIAIRAALGTGVLLLCGLVFFAGAWAAAAGGGTVVAALVIAAGVLIALGAFAGRFRWLVLPALTLALAAGFVSAAGIDLDGGVGQREYAPSATADLRERYELGVGEIKIDLRNTELPAGDTPLSLDVGVGHAQLVVPRDVCVATEAEVGMGAIGVFDRENGGIDYRWSDRPGVRGDGSRLVLDADVGIGAVHVSHDPDAFRDRGPFRGSDHDDENNSGCLTTAGGSGGHTG